MLFNSKENIVSTGVLFECAAYTSTMRFLLRGDAMEHSFDVDIAKRYGIPAAILLKNIYFWIEKNRANEKNFFDGLFWTYNSKKAFAELFPYLTERQIDYALQKLIDDGVIITGNYNKAPYDRTLWYAITKKGCSILQNCEMEATKLLNGSNENVEAIPDNKTDEKPDSKQDKKKASKGSFDKIILEYAKTVDIEERLEVTDLLFEWLKVRKAKRAAMTDRAIQMNVDKLNDLAAKSKMSVVEYLKEIICRGWAAFYAINNYGSKNNGQKVGENGIAINSEKSELDKLF